MNWIKRKLELLALSMAKVEQQTLNQHTDAVGTKGSLEQTYHKGMLADALLRGEITTSVKELRWRLYKVLEESKNIKTKIVGYDDDGLPITESYKLGAHQLNKIKHDNFDSYPVELVVKNDEIMKSTNEAFSIEKLKILKDGEKYVTSKFDLVDSTNLSGNTLAEITFDDMVTSMKSKKTIYVDRVLRPKFEIEYYTKKLLVRNINEKEKLLEFYISTYPDEYDKKTKFLISEIKKTINNPRSSDILNIDKVGFITDKTIGSVDGLEYEYEVKKFDKIVEFNGHYVIKFICEVIVNGDNIFEKYKLAELEKRYENKEAKL